MSLFLNDLTSAPAAMILETTPCPLIKANITIEDGAWVCADTFVGPDILIEKKGIVGARAVVTKDVKAGNVVAGNPAKVIGHR